MEQLLVGLVRRVERLRLENAQLKTFIYSLPEMEEFAPDTVDISPDIRRAIEGHASAVRAQIDEGADLHLVLKDLLEEPIWPGKLY